ncbi:MAG: family 16 glycosylhydrolase [Chitinophagaceae bacterium]
MFYGVGNFSDEFHVFSLEWKQDQIKWLVDRNVYGTATQADFGSNNYPFNEQFYFIFNVAVGGNWPGSPDANTSFPQWMIVDYVRGVSIKYMLWPCIANNYSFYRLAGFSKKVPAALFIRCLYVYKYSECFFFLGFFCNS